MKKIIPLLLSGLSFTIFAMGQLETDTLFYDKEWKGVENKAFATYFRVIPRSIDSNFRKQFRDYYITGELQSEDGYISIDKYDDSKSIFDGEWMNYYKSGKIEQKGKYIKGKQEGEYTNIREMVFYSFTQILEMISCMASTQNFLKMENYVNK